MVVKVGIAKLGNIASGVMAELLLDERADREDMQTFMATSGTKLQPEDIDRVVTNMKAWGPDFCVVVSPNGVLPGPTGAREELAKAGIPVVVITDDITTKKEQFDALKASTFGYIIMKADSMIGARREFLDPIEMADYNGNLVKVLALTGAFRKLQFELDKVINQVKAGKKGADLVLPKVVMTSDKAVEGEFSNPYALAKARAAYEIASAVAGVNVKGCFMTKEWEKYIPIVCSAHEMMRQASVLCDEAREIEKASEQVRSLFLGMLDRGRIRDARGDELDTRQCVIVLTSNALRPGATGSTGFIKERRDIIPMLADHFPREFLGRLDEIILFRDLEDTHLKEILKMQLREGLERFVQDGVEVRYDEDQLLEHLLRGLREAKSIGARGMKRLLERVVWQPLAVAVAGYSGPKPVTMVLGDEFYQTGRIQIAGTREGE